MFRLRLCTYLAICCMLRAFFHSIHFWHVIHLSKNQTKTILNMRIDDVDDDICPPTGEKWIRKWEDDESNDRGQRQRVTQVVEWENRRRASELMTSSTSTTTTTTTTTGGGGGGDTISALGQQQYQQPHYYHQNSHNYNRWSAGRPHTSSLFGAGCFFLGEASASSSSNPVVHDLKNWNWSSSDRGRTEILECFGKRSALVLPHGLWQRTIIIHTPHWASKIIIIIVVFLFFCFFLVLFHRHNVFCCCFKSSFNPPFVTHSRSVASFLFVELLFYLFIYSLFFLFWRERNNNVGSRPIAIN